MAAAHPRACPQVPVEVSLSAPPRVGGATQNPPAQSFLTDGTAGLVTHAPSCKTTPGARGRANKEESAFVPSPPPRVK